MLNFYRTAALTLLLLCALSAAIAYLGFSNAQLQVPILPAQKGSIPWTPRVVGGLSAAETTRIGVNEDAQLLDYTYWLSADVPYPYASYSMDLGYH